jgi:hypothetical protein
LEIILDMLFCFFWQKLINNDKDEKYTFVLHIGLLLDVIKAGTELSAGFHSKGKAQEDKIYRTGFLGYESFERTIAGNHRQGAA